MKPKQYAEGLAFAIVLVSIVMLAFAHSVDATIQTLPPVKQRQCVNLPQLELNSTFQNITALQKPDKTLELRGVLMTKSGSFYNYSFCNTSILGTYVVNGCSDITCWAYDFEVNSTGAFTTTFQGIIYVVVLALLVGLFIMFGAGAIKIPSENYKTQEGEVIKIQWKKYLKWFCWTMCYIIVVGVVYVCWNLSYAFLFLTPLTNIFRLMFRILLGLALPVFAFGIVYGLIMFFRDKKMENMLERGLTIKW